MTLWADQASRYEYLAQMRWRLQLDFDGLPSPVKHAQYFPPDLFDIKEDEIFVDCGAYDGDSLRVFMERQPVFGGRWIAIEPDPLNLRALAETLSTVTQEYMDKNPKLKFAAGPNDTGVIISFNTQSQNLPPGGNPILISKPALAINPITWTRDETPATAAQGLGSFMPAHHEIKQFTKVPHYADARVDNTNGVVICTTADEAEIYNLLPSWPKGAYHVFDYALYYFNIRQNAENRANKFLGK